jgi:ATP-binding cassette subfamily B protein
VTAAQPGTVRRVDALVPQFRAGLGVTLALAAAATVGRVQVVLDRGLRGGHAHLGTIRDLVSVGVLAVLVTAGANIVMNARLYRASETGLAHLRVLAFRHIHDLSALHQAAERRGALVSRVTGDIDTVSIFMQFGGIFLITAGGQLLVATALMFVYSWQLALLVLASFGPLGYVGRPTARCGSASERCSARSPNRSSERRPSAPMP